MSSFCSHKVLILRLYFRPKSRLGGKKRYSPPLLFPNLPVKLCRHNLLKLHSQSLGRLRKLSFSSTSPAPQAIFFFHLLGANDLQAEETDIKWKATPRGFPLSRSKHLFFPFRSRLRGVEKLDTTWKRWPTVVPPVQVRHLFFPQRGVYGQLGQRQTTFTNQAGAAELLARDGEY